MFRKTSPQETWFVYPASARTAEAFFCKYTNRRHFFSPTPYVRFLNRAWRLGSSTVRANLASEAKLR